MKILLITVPAAKHIAADMSGMFAKDVRMYPPLGLIYLYSTFKRLRPDDEIRILDSVAERFDEEDLLQHILAFKPDIIGITVLTFFAVEVYRCIAAIKAQLPRVLVVLGGPHAHLFPEEVLENPYVDYVMTGEGEYAFPKLVEHLEHQLDPADVPGIFYHDSHGKCKRGAPPESICRLDELPLPDLTAVPIKLYYSVMDKGLSASLITSRGCPNHCVYCARPHLGNVYRAHSPQRVVTEISRLIKLGIRHFQIFDDTFTINRQRVLDICRLIRKQQLDISFSARSRVNTVDEDLLKALKQAGCRRLSFGVEAASDRALRALKKGITIAQVQRAFTLCHQIGIETLADFILGGPGQTRADVEDTISFAIALRPAYVQFTIMTPFPGTELYRMGLEKGIITTDYWREFARDPSEDFETPVWEEYIPKEELLELFNRAYRRFYHRPSFLLKELSKIRSFGELYTKVKIGLKMFSVKNL